MTDVELIYVKTIIEEKSLSKAAEKLFVSQPSLSKSLQKIEYRFGTRLFKRTNTGLIPTLAGERYYQMAKDILKIYNDFEIEISDINNLKKGKITVGITPQLATYMLPVILPLFKEECPNIDVSTIERNSSELEKALASGEIDFAIMFISPFNEVNNILDVSLELIFKDTFLLVAKKGHRLGKYAIYDKDCEYPRIDITLFSDEPFIITDHGLRIRQVSELILQKADINPLIALTTKSFETARRLASQGVGITFIPRRYINIFPSTFVPDYYTIDEKYTPYWNLCLAIYKGAYVSKAARTFMNIIKKNFN